MNTVYSNNSFFEHFFTNLKYVVDFSYLMSINKKADPF